MLTWALKVGQGSGRLKLRQGKSVCKLRSKTFKEFY